MLIGLITVIIRLCFVSVGENTLWWHYICFHTQNQNEITSRHLSLSWPSSMIYTCSWKQKAFKIKGHCCQDLRGLWPKRTPERNEQMRHTKGLTHSGREWQDTWPEGWWPTGKILFFSASFIQKRKKLNYQKHSDLETTFLFLPPCILTTSVLD
jgi:hypothetical protein